MEYYTIMSVVALLTATNINAVGATVNYTLNSFASNIYLYRFPSNTIPSRLDVTGTRLQTIVPGTINGSNTDSNLTPNTPYTYAFYNGNVTGTATPYSPSITIKTYASVTSFTTSLTTETATQINYTLSNTLNSTITCYLFRFSSATSIPSAPSTLNTSTGTFITSINVSSGSPAVVTSNYTDSTVFSNISYTYAFYNGQDDSVSTILTDTSLVAKSASSTTFATITNSSITSTNISNSSATINYTLTNALSSTTSSYLFRFAASSAPSTDPTSGVQVGSAISGSSSTPINNTGLSANTQYTFAFYNGSTSSATILRDATTSRVAQSTTIYTTNVLNTSLTANSISPASTNINYTLSNSPSSIGTTVYLYRFTGNSAPTILTGGTQVTSVSLTANNLSTSSSFSSTGLTVNTTYTYAFYSGNATGTSIVLTTDGSTASSVTIITTVTTVAFTAVSNILNTSSTLNYTLTNINSNTVPSYLYRFTGASAPALLNTSTGTYITTANSIGTAATTNESGLTVATQYTYAFYNGQVNGTSSILTNIAGVVQSVSFNTTNLLNTSITPLTELTLNTQTAISYTLTNLGVNTSSATTYLYRFSGDSAPSSNPTTGTFMTIATVNANTSFTNSYINTGLPLATQYTYAFYNGNTSSAIILTNASTVNQSVTLATTNIVINTITTTNITNTSAQINYNISNSNTSQGSTVYLYRFTTPPPTTFNGGGINITNVAVSGNATVDSYYNNTGLSSVIHYYAFYNGNAVSYSKIIPIATGGNYIIVKPFLDVSSLTATNITTTTAVINYTINNGLSVDLTSYLYRFNGYSAPTTNPTSGTNLASVTTTAVNNSISTYSETSLTENTVYTYAFYNGTSSSATILTNINGTAQSVNVVTTEYLTSFSVSNVALTSVSINYSIRNPLTSQVTVYLYRFIGNTAPTIDPTTDGTVVTTVTINANSSLNTQTFSNTGLTKNTLYTYAFYLGNNSSSNILIDIYGNAQRISIFTDMYVRILSISYITNNFVVLTAALSIGNGGSNSVNSNTSYMYRFVGATAPSILDTSIGTQVFSYNWYQAFTAYSPGLLANTQYTYAFYDGSVNGVSQIMYSGNDSTIFYPLTAKTLTVYTSNQVVNLLTSSAVSNTSSLLNYSITNNPSSSNSTSYLYRFTSIPPSILLNGALVGQYGINANAIVTNSSIVDNGLTASTIYYYAFYNGTASYNGYASSVSSILPISGGGNSYIMIKTTGVNQTAISASAIASNSATINYSISNAANSSSASIYLYRYSGSLNSVNPLNTTTAIPVTSLTLDASASITTSTSVTDLSANTIYAFHFYNGNINGYSPILSYVTLKTGVSTTAISVTNVFNTTATINYTLSNTNNSNITVYLYRNTNFGSISPVSTATIYSGNTTISAGTIENPTVKTGSIDVTGLDAANLYTFAFYNGQTNGYSTVLTNTNGTANFTWFYTQNLFIRTLTFETLTISSVIIRYIFIGSGSTGVASLYRFIGNSAPSILDKSIGTSITSVGVGGGIQGIYTDTGLPPNTTYTYAFYNGDLDGSSLIVTDGSIPKKLTIFTTVNAVINTLSTSGLTISRVTINYTLYNNQNSLKTAYLYRFQSFSAPAILDTSTGTNITSATIAAVNVNYIVSNNNPVPVPTSITSSYLNTALTVNTTYTYGFYSGNIHGNSVLLNDYSGTQLSTTIYTTNESIVNSITYSTLTNTFIKINYNANNNQPDIRSLYLYRFLGTTAPLTLSLTNANLLTNFTLTSGNSITNSILDTGLTLNTDYTYAFYSGNISGNSIILTSYTGTPQTFNIATTYIFNTVINASNISTSGATINYTVANTPSSSGIIIYLYRFKGLNAPGTLTITGNYISATPLTNFAVSGGSTINSSYIDNSLSANFNYTYAFYNGNIVGTNTILQKSSTDLSPMSVTMNSYNGIIMALSISNTNNTSTNINYSIITDLTDNITVYLYRFYGNITAPSILNTSLTGATYIANIILLANQTTTSSNFDSGLLYNSQYTYAIYNGRTTGTSTILTNSSDIGQYVVATTSNIYNPSLTSPVVTTTSVTIEYTLTNNPSNTNTAAYLYRFSGSSVPSTLSGGTMLTDVSVTAGNSVTSSYVDSTVTPDNTYTYAFYNGNVNGVSLILLNNSTNLNTSKLTVYTFYDVMLSLSTVNPSNTYTYINYSIQNTLTIDTTAYLYRFLNNITPPSILDTSLTGANNITSINISRGNTYTSSYFDSNLAINNIYTYALYNGTSSGSSVILTDLNNVVVNTITKTTNIYNPLLLNTFTYTSSVTVNYTLNNNPSNSDANVSLYRFTANSAPSILSSNGTILNSTIVSKENVISNTDYVDNTVMIGNTYTYAYYSGNVISSSVILQDTSTNLQNKSVTVDVFYDLILSLSASGTTNTSTYINYSIKNTLSSSNIVYLYRFNNIITPPTILNTDLSGATNIMYITILAKDTTTSYYLDTTLSFNSQYTYAFYNGNTNGSSTIITNINNIGQSVEVATSNVYNPILTADSIATDSVTLAYTLNNNPSFINANVFLYRFSGTSVPSILNTDGTLLLSDVTVNTIETSTYTDTTVIPNHTYTYAFYDGSNNNISPILLDNSTNLLNTKLTVYTFYDIVTQLTVGPTANTYTTINYSIQNVLSYNTTAYLYRFDGLITPPITLNTDSSGATFLTSILITENSTNTSYYIDQTLSANSPYTYAFYNGNENEISIILTNFNNDSQYVEVSTSNVYTPTFTTTSNTTDSVTINYTLNNNPSNSDANVFLYRFPTDSAPSTLSSDGTVLTSTIVSKGNVISNTDYIDNTVMFGNTYTYAFYDGNVISYSIILQDNSTNLQNQSWTVDIFYGLILSLSASGTTNTSTTINYSIENTLTSSTIVYLYRFDNSITPPNILDTTLVGATNLMNITILANNTTTSYYLDPTLSLNSQYTYAFYNGNTNESSTIITNINNIGQSVEVATSNVYNPILSTDTLSTDSVTFAYTLNNDPSAINAHVFLYRFAGTSVPSVLNTDGTLLLSDINVNTIETSTYTDNTVIPNHIYTYAFYDGSNNGISPILQDNSTNLQNNSLTIYTFYDIVTQLTVGTTANTYTTINYSIQNVLSYNTTAYLYRFSGLITPPTTLNTDLSGSTFLTNILITANSTNTSYYIDQTLSANSQYTYAFYNGNTNGVSIILTDASNTSQYVGVLTSNIYNPTLDASSISIDSVTINYTLINNPAYIDAAVYLYRFVGNSAPSVLSGGSSVSNSIVVNSNNRSSSSIIDSTISQTNTYTYAFYNGNLNGSSAALLDNSTNLLYSTLTVNIYYGIVLELSTSNTTNRSTVVNYSIQNTLNESSLVYLYRFNGNITAPSPLNITSATVIISIPVSTNSTNTSNYTDTILNPSSTYTYALYNGSIDGSSEILTNSENMPIQTQFSTDADYLPPNTYDVNASTYKNTSNSIALAGTDPQNSVLTYIYESPSHGTLSRRGQNIVYTPNSGYIGNDYFTYYATNRYNLSSTPSIVTIIINEFEPPCFKEGSKILCFNEKEREPEYIPIENIRKGTLVKTVRNGYLKVDMIGKSIIYNSGNDERISNRLYVCAKDKYPGITEDLILTGYHSILVKHITDKERELINTVTPIYVTDRHYRLPAWVDERAIPYDIQGEFTIWHLALENDDYYMNYGIYANGLLVESCSKRYLKEIANMELIE